MNINNLIKTAMIEKNRSVLPVLRLIKSKMEEYRKRKKQKDITDELLCYLCIKTELSEQRQSLNAGCGDEGVVEYLTSLLPTKKTESEQKDIIQEVIDSVGKESFGKIMSRLKNTDGLDMKYCSSIVRQMLQ